MKIISIHVENFGKLHNEDIEFTDGLNIRCEDNGWGKSTLANFIKVMFYGLQNDGKRDLSSDRKKYAPWQGGLFGGKLIFSVNGREYIATRTFGGKQAEDTFELRDRVTNLVCNDYTDKLGEELFNINAESFMRTVFINQNETAFFKATDDVNAKLGNISDGIDLNLFSVADESLKKSISSLSTRKGSEYSELRSRANDVKARIRDGQGIDKTISEIEDRIKNIKASLETIKEEKTELNKKKVRQSKLSHKIEAKKQFDGLTLEVKEKEDNISALKEGFFHDRVPSERQVEEWKQAVVSLNSSEAVIKSQTLNMAERDIFKELSLAFYDNTPAVSEIDANIAEADKLADLRQEESKVKLSEEEEEKLTFLSDIYETPAEAVNDVNESLSDWDKRNRLVEEETKLEQEEASLNSKFSLKGLRIILAIAGIIFELGAILLIITGPFNFIYGILGGAGLALIIFSLLLTGQKNRKQAGIASERDRLQEEIKVLEGEIKELFTLFNYDFDEDRVVETLKAIQYKVFEYDSLYKKKKTADMSTAGETADRLSKSIKDYLLRFNMEADEGDYVKKLSDLKTKLNTYTQLSNKSAEFDKAQAQYDEINKKLCNQLTDYGFEISFNIGDTVKEIEKKHDEYNRIDFLLKDALNRIADFKSKEDMADLLTPIPAEDMISMEDLQAEELALTEREDTLKENLQTDRNNLQKYEESADELEDAEAELEELQEELDRKELLHDRLETVRELLTKAKENLTAKYMGPLLNGFKEYYGLISEQDCDKYFIDANINVTKEEMGAQRNIDTLSGGLKDLVGFSMRIAMAKAMYPDEKPILILDDPFVFFDKGKREKGNMLLKKLSEEYQILYLTCNESNI